MAKFRKFEWYQSPLYYDIVFSAGTKREADFLQVVHKKYVLSGGRNILEPACGPGRLLLELASHGFDVNGFDASRPMVRLARHRFQREGLQGVVKKALFEDFAFQRRFDLAFCLVSSFQHILRKANARQHLRLVADHLKPGRVYVIGLHLTDYDEVKPTREKWKVERDGVRVTCKIKTWIPNRKTNTARMRSRIIAKQGRRTQRLESNWVARTYSGSHLKALLSGERRLQLIACHEFDYDIKRSIPLGKKRYDNVPILRRIEDPD